ncbi:MAG: SRPBCC domain-containing protein [candidate division Zixibacteria bacterium]|nr:SRPBCC domain-containing protein [candidate division Zixibacteria bacterium]
MAVKKKHDWSQFTHKIAIAAPPEKVFRAWIDDKICVKWFTEVSIIEPVKGGRIYLKWIGGDVHETKVTDIKQDKLFVFPFGPNGEQVSVSISKITGGSLCELHQYGMKDSPDDRVKMHLGCVMGWTFFLTNLKAFLEHRIDLRTHTDKACYLQGYING